MGDYPVRDPGDAWVTGPDGKRFWGRYGAAGLLLLWPGRGVLLQHRAAWSHHGGTWGIPGGAINEGERADQAALREAAEEAGVDPAHVRVVDIHVLDLGFWSYTTLLAVTHGPQDIAAGDAESVELRWVGMDDVDSYQLHPMFAATWPGLRERFADGGVDPAATL